MAAHILIAGGGIAGLATALALARRAPSHRPARTGRGLRRSRRGHPARPQRHAPPAGARASGSALVRIAARPDALVVRSADARRVRSPACRSATRCCTAMARPISACIAPTCMRCCWPRCAAPAPSRSPPARASTQVVARGDDAVCASSTEHPRLGGRCAGRRRRPVEHGAPARGGGRAAAARDRPHGLARAGRAVGVAGRRCAARRSRVWLGPRLHAVAYPVRRGEALNVVVLAEAAPAGDARDWDQASSLAALQAATGRTCGGPAGAAGGGARHGAPGRSATGRRSAVPTQMAGERVALAGDAAHPMLPYLAQGAGMAIEDARGAGRGARWRRRGGGAGGARALRRRRAGSAMRRCRRGRGATARSSMRPAWCAWAAMRPCALLGARLLDVPWLYGA